MSTAPASSKLPAARRWFSVRSLRSSCRCSCSCLAACEPGMTRRQPFSRRRLLERHPYGAVGERADRPVVAVLVPGGLVALGGRLAEHVAAPEDQVLAEHAAHQLDDLRIARQIEKGAAAAHAFAVVALHVRRDELLGSHAGVLAQQRVEGLGHRRDSGLRAGESAGPPSLRRGTVRSPRQAAWPCRNAARAARRRVQTLADPGDDLRRLGRARLALELAAALHQQQGRDAADRELRRGLRAPVAVDLGEQRLAAKLRRRLCELRRHRPAGAAPVGPEVDHDRQLGAGDDLVEAGIVEHHRRLAEQLPAAAAAGRRVLKARIGDAVGREAVRADDQHDLLPGNSGSRPGRCVAGPPVSRDTSARPAAAP